LISRIFNHARRTKRRPSATPDSQTVFLQSPASANISFWSTGSAMQTLEKSMTLANRLSVAAAYVAFAFVAAIVLGLFQRDI
jgi:hypothetical protein